MPELPEVERVRRNLERAMTGARFDRVTLNRRDLRRPFPAGFARRLRRQTVRSLSRRGKYLLAELSSGDTLIIHLGMSGWFRVEPVTEERRGRRDRRRNKVSAPRSQGSRRSLVAGGRDREAALENRHDHVIFSMSSGQAVIFNDPRRFGMMDLVSAAKLPDHDSLGALGPEPLSRAFDAAALASRAANRRVALKVALLDQQIVAGIGNIYASEALHLARLSPFREASTIATAAGAPRQAAVRLSAAIKAVLRRAIALKESGRYRERRFRVYDREGEPCVTPGCRGTIARITQAGRSTFYCPSCQR
jgi:formamidopyrimidine-DNA glycosylase